MRPGGTTSGWRRPGSSIGSEGGVNSGGLLMGPLGFWLGGCLRIKDGTSLLRYVAHHIAAAQVRKAHTRPALLRMPPAARPAGEAEQPG